MNIQILRGKPLSALRLICAVNFKASLTFLLLVSVISVLDQPIFFDDYSDLYGPMIGNLRLMLLYLAISDFAVYGYCRFSGNYQAILLLGVFFLTLILAVEFYGVLNQVPIDENYAWFFLYLGLSHLGYGRFTIDTIDSNP